MLSVFIPQRLNYNGAQIESLWAYKKFGIKGDSIVGFIGGCNIPFDKMVDEEDKRHKSKIYSRLMLHFIIEHFETDLERAILRQRLFACIVKDSFMSFPRTGESRLKRIGDDLYDGACKLSISIATVRPVSTKIHFGINIDSRGTPVKTKGLKDYQIEPRPFGLEVIRRYIAEMDGIKQARYKTNWVR
ncbi:MAG: DUF366 family protein [Planctomycetes bacterium]|nr:DUF366 family protein [Planctomycetota bacterium]